jgi:superoxide dismutase, Fe-Mn family
LSKLAIEDPQPAAGAITRHRLPPLPYAVDALEPCIDARTMTLHHDVHHLGYVDKLNATLAKLPQLKEASPLWLLCNLTQIPHEKRAAVHLSAGGHVNHSLFWQTMTPDSAAEPLGALRDALCQSSGSIASFKSEFESGRQRARRSGWVWLVAPPGTGGRTEARRRFEAR